jgi:hypothetical protein
MLEQFLAGALLASQRLDLNVWVQIVLLPKEVLGEDAIDSEEKSLYFWLCLEIQRQTFLCGIESVVDELVGHAEHLDW